MNNLETVDRIGFIDDSKDIPLPDLNSIGEVMAGANPLSSTPNMGMGKKSYIQLTLKKHNIGIEFYAEHLVSTTPEAPSIGFQHSDVTLQTGVSIYTIEKEHKEEKKRRFFGRVITLKEFLQTYITDDVCKLVVERCMENLIEESKFSDKFMEHLNDLWRERKVNTNELYKVRIC